MSHVKHATSMRGLTSLTRVHIPYNDTFDSVHFCVESHITLNLTSWPMLAARISRSLVNSSAASAMNTTRKSRCSATGSALTCPLVSEYVSHYRDSNNKMLELKSTHKHTCPYTSPWELCILCCTNNSWIASANMVTYRGVFLLMFDRNCKKSSSCLNYTTARVRQQEWI